MQELWSATSYEAHLLSLPFALAPAAMLIVIAYTAVMRGAPVLRGWLLAHCLCLLPYGIVIMLSPSITSGPAADKLFRVAAAFVPMAAATGTGFQLALVRKYRRYRWLAWFLVANAAIWIVVALASDAAISGIQWLGRLWFPTAGPYAWIALVHTVLICAPGFGALGYVALKSKPSHERRQLRTALVANLVTYAGLVDVGLGYGIGVFPLGWLLSGIGSLLVVRALVVEDLLRVRAVDTGAPLLVVHLAVAILLGWIALAQIGDDAPWWMVVLVLAMCFLSVRNTVATAALIDRGARSGGGPLERLLAQLVTRARALTDPEAIAQLAIDIIDLGVGIRPPVLLASEQDWGWTIVDRAGASPPMPDSMFGPTERATGPRRLADELAPDPLVMSWLAEHRAPLFADDLEAVPADLRELVAKLLERHHARAVVPVRSADELLGLIVIPLAGARIRGRSLAFIERVAERFAEAMLYARMARRAAERAELAREVELAATVQAELLPAPGPHVVGDITVVGSWVPATRCAGDFWGVYPLGDGRVLVAIGDVTGHGVASAMVTAAALGACDVCARRVRVARPHDMMRTRDPAVELGELIAALDAVVRRVGGGELAMTCFATILDSSSRTAFYVSCGHTAPYVCRPAAPPEPGAPTDTKRTGQIDLQALVGRGNPLGAGVPATPRVHERALEAGDVVVWYTDGVIEAQDPAGKPYGDRRLQQLLRRIDRQRLTPGAVHDLIQTNVAAHRAGRLPADDETVVVAQIAGTP